MKPGYKTTEFWLSLLGMALPILQTIHDTVPAANSVWVSAIIAAAYTASRAFVKSTAPAP